MPHALDDRLLDAATSARKAIHLIHLARSAFDGAALNEANLNRLRRAAEHLADAENGVLQILKETE